MRQTPEATRGNEITELLDRWASRGLLSPEQVERIRQAEGITPAGAGAPATPAAPAAPRGRLAAEALAYLGGVLALAAALLLVQLVWDDLSVGARLAVPLSAAAVLLLSGRLVPGDAADRVRLRSVLWLLGTAATAVTVAVFGDQVLETDAEDTVLLAGLATSVLGLGLYLLARTAAQQLGFVVPVAVTAGALGMRAGWDEPTLVGVGVWLVAAAWAVLGALGVAGPATAVRFTAAVGLLIGAPLTQGSAGGQLLAALTIVGLFTWGVLADSLGLLALASIGTLNVVPAAITYFFPDSLLAAPLSLLAIGAVLVGAAVVVTRRRSAQR